jgi:transcriptional regulator with GAF, ATPase, and Fis domain
MRHHLVDPSEHGMREIRALRAFGQSLCSSTSLEPSLQSATSQVTALLEAESSALILVDEERQQLYFKVADDRRSGVEQRLREIRFPIDRGIAGWAVREGTPTIVPDVEQDWRFYRDVDVQTRTRTRSYLCVPLKTREKTLGVLTAVNKRRGPFGPRDLVVSEAFATQVAIAIHNDRLTEALRQTRDHVMADGHSRDEDGHSPREDSSYSPGKHGYSLGEDGHSPEEDGHFRRPHGGCSTRFETLVGSSPRMREVYRLVEPILATRTTVLLLGESGTGKELVARAIHAQGQRPRGPFIAVNCAALPEALLEAELFGHERSAFTGATHRKPGRFELAAGGTLFLDEIGEMSPGLQAKLLRALQDKTFERVGGTATIKTDARIIAATNRDLEALIAQGTFREDLYYRLNVYPIPLPPLREREDDVLGLALHFLAKYGTPLRGQTVRLSPEARELLAGYHWPGNIRELENVIERAVILCDGHVVKGKDLPSRLGSPPRLEPASAASHPAYPTGTSLAGLEKQYILQALEQAGYNRSRAGTLLGLSRTQLRTRLRKHGIDERSIAGGRDRSEARPAAPSVRAPGYELVPG